jgi:UPF0176 protein
MAEFEIVSFYKFFKLTNEEVALLEQNIIRLADEVNSLAGENLTARGLFIIGTEGINTTFSTPKIYAEFFKSELLKFLKSTNVDFKISEASAQPFKDLVIKIRTEIVTIDRPDLVPSTKNHHLTPEEWHKVIEEEQPIIIDTRNSFEYEVGHFKEAIDPKTRVFSQFPKWVATSNIPKDQKVLIYCTGGIRCEKAILDMQEQGYENVFQLDGGILNYLKSYPQGHWNGECFVFDYRVALTPELKPTETFRLCPHCGQPGKELIHCDQCQTEAVVCEHCLALGPEYKTCTKNCLYHYGLTHLQRQPKTRKDTSKTTNQSKTETR